MYGGYADSLGSIPECRFITEVKSLKTIKGGQKTQKYRKNRTPILPPEITRLKSRLNVS
jgi:hypothetical protein